MKKLNLNKAGSHLTDSQKHTLSVLGKYLMPLAFCLFLFILCIGFGPKVSGNRSSDVKKQNEEIARITDELDAAKNQVKMLENGLSGGSSAGVYTGRDNDEQWKLDDEAASAFFSKICTWSDGDYYESLRTEFKSMGYEDTDSLMVCFLPAQKITYDVDVNSPTYGQRISEIDEKNMNMRFEALTSYRIESGNSSRYAALVRMSSQDAEGYGGISEVYAYVKYTVSQDGSLTDVEAYALEN